MWLNDKFDTFRFELFRQLVEFLIGEAGTEMGDWYLVAVDWIEVICPPVILTDPVAHKLISKEVIILPLGGRPSFLQAQNPTIKLFGLLQIVHWNSQMEWETVFVGIAGCFSLIHGCRE